MSKANLISAQSPSMEPILSEQSNKVSNDAPTLNPNVEGDSFASSQAAGAPSVLPPSVISIGSGTTGIAAWHDSKKAVALWSNSSPRNSWVSLTDLNWKKLNTANDSSNLALTMLASHAEQTNSTVRARIEDDELIHEMYVW